MYLTRHMKYSLIYIQSACMYHQQFSPIWQSHFWFPDRENYGGLHSYRPCKNPANRFKLQKDANKGAQITMQPWL